MPTYLNVSTANDQQPQHSGSAPVDPDSPLSVGMSSTATSVSEVRIAVIGRFSFFNPGALRMAKTP